MKYCVNCGAQLEDDARFCGSCGAMDQGGAQPAYAAAPQPNYAPAPQQNYAPVMQPNYGAPQGYNPYQPQREASGLAKAALVLMIIGTIAMGWMLIPLAWCLPMTISYGKKIKSGIPVGTGFKVCSLLFVNTIAGILMLCDKND